MSEQTAEDHLIALIWGRVNRAIEQGEEIDPFVLRWDLQHHAECDCPGRLPYARDLLAAERAKVDRVRVVLARAEPKTPGVRLFVNWLHAAIADEPAIP